MKTDKYMRYIENVSIFGCISISVLLFSLLFIGPSCEASANAPSIKLSELTCINPIKIDKRTEASEPMQTSVSLSIATGAIDTTSNEPYLEVSEDDIYLISQILYLEARGESIECQEATVSVILNRMTNHSMTAEEVIFTDNQFSTASRVSKAKPSEEMIELVRNIFNEGPTIPEYVTYFRAKRYHEWNNKYGTVVKYDKIDNTYFSYDIKLKQKYEEHLGETNDTCTAAR